MKAKKEKKKAKLSNKGKIRFCGIPLQAPGHGGQPRMAHLMTQRRSEPRVAAVPSPSSLELGRESPPALPLPNPSPLKPRALAGVFCPRGPRQGVSLSSQGNRTQACGGRRKGTDSDGSSPGWLDRRWPFGHLIYVPILKRIFRGREVAGHFLIHRWGN